MLVPANSRDKIPIKRIVQNLGNVTIGQYGYSDTISIDTIAGYTCIGAQLKDFSSNPSYSPFSLMMYSNASVIILGKVSSTINGLKIVATYVSNDYFDIQTS